MTGTVATWVCAGAGAVPPPTAGANWLAVACAGGGVAAVASAGGVAAGVASAGGAAGGSALPSAGALSLAADCPDGPPVDAVLVVSAALSVPAGWLVAGCGAAAGGACGSVIIVGMLLSASPVAGVSIVDW